MADRKRPNSNKGASGSETRQRTYIVAVRLNGAERAELTRRADRAGLSVPSYIRHQALDVAPPRQRPRPNVETVLLARLLGQIGDMGSAVNDMAETVRASRYLTDGGLDQLDRLHGELSRWGEKLLRAMGRGVDDDH